ncbi:MAG: hypothetical protein DSZ06_01200 [Sulfurospirillum sp.]|nr:MAG: hypothetical protein DSZ06_01200 [Sulfurospirillum sp.]
MKKYEVGTKIASNQLDETLIEKLFVCFANIEDSFEMEYFDDIYPEVEKLKNIFVHLHINDTYVCDRLMMAVKMESKNSINTQLSDLRKLINKIEYMECEHA